MRQQALEDLARGVRGEIQGVWHYPAQAAEIMLHVKEEEK